MLGKIKAGQHFSLFSHEKRKQREFFGRKVDALSGTCHPTPQEVQL
ncbi:hypothetical protein L505_0542 [Bordetella bronchiseptica F4563]|nr:hypothetical protein L505_0542 [Bordetella bronchiseptica F4563]